MKNEKNREGGRERDKEAGDAQSRVQVVRASRYGGVGCFVDGCCDRMQRNTIKRGAGEREWKKNRSSSLANLHAFFSSRLFVLSKVTL